MKRLGLLSFALLITWSVALSQQTPVQLTDMLAIKQLGSVSISPDGSTAVFTVTSSIKDEKEAWQYPYGTQIWSVALDGNAAPRQLTTAAASASRPAISPDGKSIAFVRSVDKKPQVHVLSLSGGEARQITYSANGASSPKWSPDGQQILYAVSYTLDEYWRDSLLDMRSKKPEWPLEKPGLTNSDLMPAANTKADPNGNTAAIRAWLALNEKDQQAKVINRLSFQEEATTTGTLSVTQHFLISADGKGKPTPVAAGFTSFSNPQFIGQSQNLIVEAPNNLQLHPDRADDDNAIYRFDVNTALAAKIVGAADSSFRGAKVSPSGKWMAFTYGRSSFAGQSTLAIMPVQGRRSDAIVIPHDREANNLQWSTDESFLYFTSPSNGGVVLYRYTPGSKKIEALTNFNTGISSFDVAANKLVYVKTEVNNPFELYKSDGAAKAEQSISDFNRHWVSQKQVSLPEKRTFKNELGLEIEYWIMKPINWVEGKKYPVILEIHGGPTAMWGPGESSMWHEYQYYCAKGYAVVYANPRGSGGYGEKFLQANINDWGNGPMTDVLTALDKATAEYAWMDKNNMAVTGGSYAGYLIAYMLGHDTRFKVACAQRGVYDLRTFFGEGNASRLVPAYFGGYPWEKKTHDILERESPITYVQNIVTPLIIFHGEQDLRTGVIQSEQLYKSLKTLNRPVEYVRHPGATHEITRSGNNRQRMDQMLRTYEFFERYITH